MNVLRIATVCLTVFVFSLMTTSSFAVQQRHDRRFNSSERKTFSILVTIPMGDITYKVADTIVNEGSQGDGIIDFANTIEKIERPDVKMGIRFPPGTRFPLTVRRSYSRPGNQISNHSSLSIDKWFSGFYGRVVECHDRNGNSVPPIGRDWPKYKVSEEFMMNLQRLYEKYHY